MFLTLLLNKYIVINNPKLSKVCLPDANILFLKVALDYDVLQSSARATNSTVWLLCKKMTLVISIRCLVWCD